MSLEKGYSREELDENTSKRVRITGIGPAQSFSGD